MKSLEYQIEKVFEISFRECNCVIGFIGGTHQQVSPLIQQYLPHNEAAFVSWSPQQRKYFNGYTNSVIYFFNQDVRPSEQLAGHQFSHIFTNNFHENEKVSYLKTKLRSPYQFEKEPMGYYTEFGVERWEDY